MGILSGLSNLFKGLIGMGGGSSMAGGTAQGVLSPQQLSSQNMMNSRGYGIGNALKSFGNSGLGGLATIFGSQMLGNPKPPSMPDSFNKFMSQMNAGGTPGMQSANQYYQGVLSGQNQGAYDAATQSIDQSYDDEVRKLHSMYKSLRPGTDPSTDSTYQRDLNLLNQNYAQNRAMVQAGVQSNAAQGLAGLGQQQMGGQMAAIEAQVDQIASMWRMNYAQRDALRKQLMGLGAYNVTGNPFSSLGSLFGGR